MINADVMSCPYCGSTEIELLQFDEDGEYAAIFCRMKNCRASGPVVDTEDDGNNEYDESATYAKALAAWNSRPRAALKSVGEKEGK
jgi:hypothetical protein